MSGTGWCHPTDGGSRIGIKIDDGAISHLDTAVHANQTIWAIWIKLAKKFQDYAVDSQYTVKYD